MFALLEQNILCSMATVPKRGKKAHINTAYFAYSKRPELFFCSYPESVHCQNLAENPSMAMTVYSSDQEWGKPKDQGLQFFGACFEAAGASRQEAEKIYGSRFKGYWKWKLQLEKQMGAFPLKFYRFTHNEVKIFDEPSFGEAVWVRVTLGK